MGDGANRRGVQVERQVRLRLLGAFRNRTRVVREARFLDVLNAVAGRLSSSEQVANRQRAQSRRDNAGNAVAGNQRRTSRTAGAYRAISRGDVSMFNGNADGA